MVSIVVVIFSASAVFTLAPGHVESFFLAAHVTIEVPETWTCPWVGAVLTKGLPPWGFLLVLFSSVKILATVKFAQVTPLIPNGTWLVRSNSHCFDSADIILIKHFL